ncbi:UNVERIFIED_CONTAM: putative thimet oligopeptidase [Sesamum latifolium]|uniref:Thimet oligopeptidase n=1 Tax=Sesamum latifolium TaxID=2727402 RepID=A0AAW2UX33_9LAMI
MEIERKRRERRNLIVLTGAAAVLAVAVNFAFTALNTHIKNRKKKVVPGSNVRINLSASEILRLADHIVAKSKEVHDAVASVPLDKVTYASTILPLVELEAQQFHLIQSCAFPKLVSASEDIRKASTEAERRIDAHVSGCSKREDVYRVIKAFTARGDWMSSEVKRFAQYLVQDFERNGLNLTSTKREELQRLRAQIDELSMRYIRNLNDDNTFLLFHDMELVGLPPEFLKSLEKTENGKFKVVLRSHHVSPILELCRIDQEVCSCGLWEEMRSKSFCIGKADFISLKIFCTAISSISFACTRSGMILIIALRFFCDSSYDESWEVGKGNSISVWIPEDLYMMEILLEIQETDVGSGRLSIQGVDRVSFELFSCVINLPDYWATRTMQNTLLTVEWQSRQQREKRREKFPFGIEDLPYYVKKIKEQQFDLDFGVVKQYFPINLVLSGIFKICQDLFGLRFEEVEGAEVWHQDVQLFSVFDLSSGELMGYFYIDIYSREGKYGHTCVVSLQNGSWINSTRQIPVALLISQLQKEVDGHPGLLRFSEVVNLLHEFGHVVHHICNRAPFARFSGLRLDPDFVEIPSLLLEKWCYESSSLKLISGFHQDITKPIDDEMCKSLKRWWCSFSALKLKQEILYCLFDQIIHSTENVDMIGLFKHLHSKVMLGLPMLEGTNPASCFPRTAIGYEATCYSRIWSEVFAADIFAMKFHDDIFNQNAGIHFRNKVLAPGGAKTLLRYYRIFLEGNHRYKLL